jgi:hypothetical protein
MKLILKEIEKVLNHIFFSLLIYSGLFLLIAGLVAWSSLTVRILVGLTFLMLSYFVGYLAYKVWTIKRLLNK